MATRAQQKAFLLQWGDDAARVADLTGIPDNYVLGQWALETGWGTHFAGAYNVGNIQGNNPTPYNYNTEEQGALAYAQTLKHSRYDMARTALTPQDFGQSLQLAGYATDPDYASKVSQTIGTVQDLVAREGGFFNFGDFDWGNQSGGETPEIVNEHGQMPDGITAPLEWVKNKWLDIGFLALGVVGLAFFAWKFTPAAVKEAAQ